MHNESFLKELIFDPGDDAHLYYYLYNYRLRCAMKPSELGLVLCHVSNRWQSFAFLHHCI
ncbi:unnamed protein product [Arabidopsis halleri]